MSSQMTLFIVCSALPPEVFEPYDGDDGYTIYHYKYTVVTANNELVGEYTENHSEDNEEVRGIMLRIVAGKVIRDIKDFHTYSLAIGFVPRRFGVIARPDDTTRLTLKDWMSYRCLCLERAGVILKNQLCAENIVFKTFNDTIIAPVDISFRNYRDDPDYEKYWHVFITFDMFNCGEDEEEFDPYAEYYPKDENNEADRLYTYDEAFPNYVVANDAELDPDAEAEFEPEAEIEPEAGVEPDAVN